MWTLPHRRALTWAFCSISVAALVTACTTSPPPAPPSTMQPSSITRVNSLLPSLAEAQGGATKPYVNGSGLIAGFSSTTSATAPIVRSEIFWAGPAGGALKLAEGDKVSVRFDVTPKMATVAADPTQWTVFWQLQGPTSRGWLGPPLALHVRNNSWRFGGGAGHPAGSKESYATPYAPYADGKRASWRIDVVVSDNPAKAVATAWLNGTRVVTNWHPPGGSRYSDTVWLGIKNGIYGGGSGGATVSSASRTAVYSKAEVTIVHQGTSVTYQFDPALFTPTVASRVASRPTIRVR